MFKRHFVGAAVALSATRALELRQDSESPPPSDLGKSADSWTAVVPQWHYRPPRTVPQAHLACQSSAAPSGDLVAVTKGTYQPPEEPNRIRSRNSKHKANGAFGKPKNRRR